MLNQASKKLSKMHARRNPNLSIQSTAPYWQLSPRVQSATTGAFLSPTVASRRGLLSRSPPVSPSLPSLVPRHGKKQIRLGPPRSLKRILIGCCGAAFLLWLILRHLYSSSQQLASYEADPEEWEMVGGNQLPQEPSVIGMQDANGDMKWAVSIHAHEEFPLKPAQYSDICTQSNEISKELRKSERTLSYYEEDENYLDVQDAEEQTLFPLSTSTGRPKGFVEDESIADGLSTTGLRICDRSLTYVMETEEVGLGDSLMRMWMSYGLAQAENRTFFIDDTRWPYGRYKSFFQSPPPPGCLPPPTAHMISCPHSARHLVVSSATVMSTFGSSFTNEWEDTSKAPAQRQHKMFALVRTGYQALFKLRTDDEDYVLTRADELYGTIRKEGGLSIGMHIRRGDKHPLEFQYQEDYIPLDRFVDTARDLYVNIIEGRSSKSKRSFMHTHKHISKRHTSSKMIIASDDPIIYESPELGPNSVRAQDRIVLATKATLDAAQGQNRKNQWIDDIIGWEGGFYRNVFLSLGQPVGNANDKQKFENNVVPQEAMQLREFVGRAYLMDLAVVGKADTVVCTVSSVACRLLAVMMGWENAVVKGRWKNIDGNFEWKAIYHGVSHSFT